MSQDLCLNNYIMSFSRHHKAFSLIEMILVVAVLSILLVASKDLFTGTSNNKYYGETCANFTYGTMRNYFYDAVVGRTITSSWQQIFPDTYVIEVHPNIDIFKLGYMTGGTGIAYHQVIDLANANQQRYCNRNDYNVFFTGVDLARSGQQYMQINIRKNLANRINQPAITIQYRDGAGSVAAFTGSVTIKQYVIKDDINRDLMRINIDSRSQNIEQQKCVIFNAPTGNCIKRQK
jgi:prepilin-type N-terminal cleavage/methylation domain-containing protein